jgi:hypothetical protein
MNIAMPAAKKEIVLLIGRSRSGVFLYNNLKQYFSIRAVIIEDTIQRSLLIKRRIKKLGWTKVMGQLAFQLIIPRLLKFFSRKRYRQLLAEYSLNDTSIDANKIIIVPSVNHQETINVLQQLNPAVVVVNGTRIISKEVLQAVSGVFLNTHAGITPKYRGVHGGYWALANKDRENCGVTIHLVDKGIDTGQIISQHRVFPDRKDNFYTYPILQLGVALPWLVKAIENAFNGYLVPYKTDCESKLWYHPTLGTYLYNWITKGLK